MGAVPEVGSGEATEVFLFPPALAAAGARVRARLRVTLGASWSL